MLLVLAFYCISKAFKSIIQDWWIKSYSLQSFPILYLCSWLVSISMEIWAIWKPTCLNFYIELIFSVVIYINYQHLNFLFSIPCFYDALSHAVSEYGAVLIVSHSSSNNDFIHRCWSNIWLLALLTVSINVL
jgi:hypothetical protein